MSVISFRVANVSSVISGQAGNVLPSIVCNAATFKKNLKYILQFVTDEINSLTESGIYSSYQFCFTTDAHVK